MTIGNLVEQELQPTDSFDPNQFLEFELIRKLKENPIAQIELKGVNTIEDLKSMFPDHPMVVTDFQVIGIETGQKFPWGYEKDGILAIDHHIPDKNFERIISSTNLAIEYVKANGPVSKGKTLVINHTDCDSVLASAVLRGIIPPDQEFGDAAIASDHTGEKDDIADLLLSLTNKKDIEFSLRNLELYLRNRNFDNIEPKAKELLQRRFDERAKAKLMVERGDFITDGHVSYVVNNEKFHGGDLIRPLLPDAMVYLLVCNMPNSDKLDIKVGLGQGAPEGMTLPKLNIKDFDPAFGGRWNAGSTSRGGGTDMQIEDFVANLNRNIEEWLQSHE